MGLHKDIKSEEEMFALFEKYKVKTKDNPFIIKDWVGKDGIEIKREKEKPLTYEGFKNYCYDVGLCIKNYFENPDGRYDDFKDICSRIKREIRQDQIEGGMAGMYNPSITQRLNGLKESTEINVTSKPILNIDPLADDSTNHITS